MKIKKVQGFILHFGYVESSRVCPLFIRHLNGGFETVEEGLKDLSTVFLKGYLYEGVNLSLENFEYWLYDQPQCVASGGLGSDTFLSAEWNNESWWPWDAVGALYPLLPYFYENQEAIENVIPCYADYTIIPNGKYNQFYEEMKAASALRSEKIIRKFSCVASSKETLFY